MGGSGSKDEGRGEKEVLADHQGSINCMAISDDGSLLITGSDDKMARMWSSKTENTECIGLLTGHSNYITCIAVHDTYVVTGSADNSLRKWDMATCECKRVYFGHTSRVQRVICTAEYIFSTSYDWTARCWLFDTDDLSDDDDACIRIFKGHTLGVTPIIYIPEDQCSDDDGDDDDDDKRLAGNQGDIVITGSFDGTAISWSFESGGKLKVFKGHQKSVTCMTTDNMGQILFTGSEDKTIRSWHIMRGEPLKVFTGHMGPVMCIQVVKDLLYSGSQDGTARCYVTQFGDTTRVYKGHKYTVNYLHFKNGLLYTVSGDTTARIFDAKSGAERKRFFGHEGGVSCLIVADNKKFYTGSSDGTFRCWDASNVTVDAAFSNNDDDDDDGHFNRSHTHRSLRDLEQQLESYVPHNDGGPKATKRKSIQSN